MFLLQSERPSFAPIQYNWQNYYSFILIFTTPVNTGVRQI
jgi:hypothetical protein